MTRSVVRHAVKGSPTTGLYAATLGFFVGFAAVALFGPTAQAFKEMLNLSPSQVGLLVAMPSLSGSLLRIPFSAWVDTTGGRKPFLVLLGLSILGMMGLSFIVATFDVTQVGSGLFPLLLLLGVLSGCGIATFSVGISQVAYWFPQSRQGWALGTYAGVGNLAPGIFSFLLPLVLGTWNLTVAYIAWLAFLVLGTGLYFFLGQNAPYFQLLRQGLLAEVARREASTLGQEVFPAGSLVASLVLSARVWKTWLLVVLYFTTFGGFIALTAWLPTYWQSYLGTSLVTAGLLTALYSLLASAIRIVGGSASDRFGGETVAIFSLSLLLLGAIFMTTSNSLPLSLLGEILMALGMGVNNAAVFKLVPQEVPEAVGGAAGWVGGLGAFGGFAVPPLMGAFVSAAGGSGYALGFVVFIVLALVSLAAAVLLRRTRAMRWTTTSGQRS